MHSRHAVVTQLLDRVSQGHGEALDDLLPLVYQELRTLAHHQLRREGPSCKLQTTSLVHETYLKLVGLNEINWESRTQLLSIASLAMRRLLIDLARKRLSTKHGGDFRFIEFDDEIEHMASDAKGMLSLDSALNDLESLDERQCRVVEYRFFGGLKYEEIASVLDISVTTAQRDWRFARAWLKTQI